MTMDRATVRLRIVHDDTKPTTRGLPHLVSVSDAQPAVREEPVQSYSGRVFALALLVGTFVGLGWIGQCVYFALTDSWIAPLHLAPDNDSIAQLRLNHQRQLAELARLDAEVTRLDGEHVAMQSAVARLGTLRGTAKSTLTWQAEQSRVEGAGLATAAKMLQYQRDVVLGLQKRQRDLVDGARTDLNAGLIDRTIVDREQLAFDQLALELSEIDRQLADITVRRTHNSAMLAGFRDGSSGGGSTSDARMPEAAAGNEHTVRVSVEIERLEAEIRGNRAVREAAVASAANQRTLLAELESRPLYRAMSRATDVAFVPYDQIRNVHRGATVLSCTWGLFNCERVGTVDEVMTGEVVTQDPWGEMARGQYVVLALDDSTAIRERVLRVRD